MDIYFWENDTLLQISAWHFLFHARLNVEKLTMLSGTSLFSPHETVYPPPQVLLVLLVCKPSSLSFSNI